MQLRSALHTPPVFLPEFMWVEFMLGGLGFGGRDRGVGLWGWVKRRSVVVRCGERKEAEFGYRACEGCERAEV